MTQAHQRPVLLRADAGTAMGTGHVMRCLAVAEALQELGYPCRLASVSLPPALADRLAEAGMAVDRLPGPIGGDADRDGLLALAAAQDAAALVVDGYDFPASYHAALATSGRRVLVFDDLADRPLHAHVVVNPAIGANALPYGRLAPGALQLLGPAYAPLRREIRVAAAGGRRAAEECHSLLVTFGGSDPLGLTVPCLERLAPALPDGVRLEVAVGGADPHAAQAAAAAARFPGRVTVRVNCRTMGTLMADAGLALAAAGSTTAELAALAVPSLLVMVAANQAAAAALSGWCRVVEAGGQPVETVADHLTGQALALWFDRDLRARMATAARTMDTGQRVDGQGAARIAQALLG